MHFADRFQYSLQIQSQSIFVRICENRICISCFQTGHVEAVLSSEQYSSVCQKYGNICNNIEMCVMWSVLLYYYTKLLIAFEI
jgi:hypothetical protein